MIKVGVVVEKDHPSDKKQEYPNIFVAQKFEPRLIFIRICHFVFFSPGGNGILLYLVFFRQDRKDIVDSRK
jgi:hypothetical protein